jgi:hypothetical protein
MIGKTTSYSEGRYRVTHQCELLNVPSNHQPVQKTLYSDHNWMVFLQSELFDVSASHLKGW